MLKLYTKTGDKGQSSLLNGERLSKSSLVFEVLGSLDEWNASLGVVVANFEREVMIPLQGLTPPVEQAIATLAQGQLPFLLQLQREVFNIGAEVAGSAKQLVRSEFLKQMEKEIDALQSILEESWRHRFVLPGGSLIAAQVDVARTTCRRTERLFVALDGERDLRQELLQVMNRSSDYLYALRSFLNWALRKKEILY